jgi:hypothetical protein
MSRELLLAGGIEDGRSAKALAAALADVGVRAGVSQAGALRLWFYENLYEFEGAQGDYVVADPGVDNLKTLTAEVDLMVSALERAKSRCRFEIYEDETLVSYHHVMWPKGAEHAL